MASGRMGGLTARRRRATSSPIGAATRVAKHGRAAHGPGRKNGVSKGRPHGAAGAAVISEL